MSDSARGLVPEGLIFHMLLNEGISTAEVVELNVILLHGELRKSDATGVWFLGSVLGFFHPLS
jgi:hypothetical protein